ncbi:MAG: S49 family peptidase [Planctomycetia bacterium]|nr:S49 family peptidase [Planctomycetia bacterium]
MTIPLDNFWSIEPGAGSKLEAALNSLSPETLRLPAVLQPALPMEIIRGVAVVDVAGLLTKRPSSFSLLFDGTSTEQVTEAVTKAAADDRVKSILLRIDSPGGSCAGLAEAADAILAARAVKPVVASVCGLCCSAAYLLASQAGQIFAHRMDLIGCIGSKMMLYDFSKMFTEAGIRAVPIDTGPYKSAGEPGTEITPAHEAYFQGIVDQFFGDFIQSIVRGRRMPEAAVRKVADGRVFVAGEALKLRLIDGIQSFDSTLAALQEGAGSTKYPVFSEETPMSLHMDATPATLQEIQQACPGMESDWYLGQLQRQATLTQAQTAALAEKDRQLAAAQVGTGKKSGVKTLEDRGGGARDVNPDAVAEFNDQVQEKMREGMTRRDAVRAVAKRNPSLHYSYVSATNSENRQVQDLIAERFSL